MPDLSIRNLHASIDGAEILKGLDLEMSKGEVHAIMGPNGSGKSTLAHVLMGHPAYEVTDGEVEFKGQNVLELEPDQRARLGLFLAFQYPAAIPGVTVANFLRMAVNAKRRSADGEENPIRIPEFRKLLQLALLRPEIAVLDETDSGLDIDALRTVAEGVNKFAGPDMGVLIITHYQRILHMVKPDAVHVMYQGRIVKEGGPELVGVLEEKGYGWIKEEVEAGAAA